MIASATIAGVVSAHGVAILAPVAVLEGPIVSVIAGFMVHEGLLVLWQAALCVILADVFGDCLFYSVGRDLLNWLPARWLERVGLTGARLQQMARTFESKCASVLVAGKLTHAAGFAVLIGVGASRMRFVPFVLANLLAASLAFLALGYFFGTAHAAIGQWLSIGSAALLLLMAGAAPCLHRRREVRR